MQKWEYATLIVDVATNVATAMDSAGRDGWEAVSAVLLTGSIKALDGYESNNAHVMCIFKRPVSS